MKPADRPAVVLSIDTSSSRSGAAVAVDGRLVAADYVDRDRPRGEDLAGCISDLLANVSLVPSDLTGVGVVRGPGSFTGVRVGLALARGIALVDDLPVVGLGSLELVAFASGLDSGQLCAALDASRDKLYVAGYRRDAGGLTELFAPELTTREKLAAALPGRLDGVWSFCAESGVAPLSGYHQCEVPDERAGVAALVAAERLAAGEGSSAEHVLPLYVADSGARPNRNRVAGPPRDRVSARKQ